VDKEERHLATIMFADMVGYSALMGSDEAKTLRFIHELEAILREEIETGRGRLVKLMGDGSMAEFPSAISAVETAERIQLRIKERNADKPPSEQFHLRAGIHLGDVVETDRNYR